MSKKITEQDLKEHPEWAGQGLKVGDDKPVDATEDGDEEPEEPGEDTGGSNPPPGKDRGKP